MERVVLEARAKVNLTLDIAGRRADGYHELDTVMQSVTLCDEVSLRKAAGASIAVSCDAPGLPQGQDNIAHRAASAYFTAAGLPASGVTIGIHKRIPSQAGLGGGSADAAAVLAGLALLFPAGLSRDALLRAAARVGADVPFCLTGGTLRARGVGERLSAVPALPACTVLVAKPEVGVSTAEAYVAFDRLGQGTAARTPALCAALRGGGLAAVGAALGNAFVDALALPEVAALCAALRAGGAVGVCMSGSGSAVYGLFDDEAAARAQVAALGRASCSVCSPAACGWDVLSQF